MQFTAVRKILYLSVILFVSRFSAYAQLSDTFTRNLEDLYNFNFLQINPSPLPAAENSIINSYKCWYKFLLCPDENIENRNVLLSYGNREKSSRENLLYSWFFKIYFDQYKIRILFHDGEDFSAYKLGLKMMDDFNSIDTSNFCDEEKIYYQFLKAAHDYFEGYAQSKYYFIRLITPGDPELKMREGIKDLEKIFKGNNLFLKTESCYLLMKIYKELETKCEYSTKYAGWLIQQYPKNIIFQIEYLTCISKDAPENKSVIDKRKEINKLITTLPLSTNERKHLESVLNDI